MSSGISKEPVRVEEKRPTRGTDILQKSDANESRPSSLSTRYVFEKAALREQGRTAKRGDNGETTKTGNQAMQGQTKNPVEKQAQYNATTRTVKVHGCDVESLQMIMRAGFDPNRIRFTDEWAKHVLALPSGRVFQNIEYAAKAFGVGQKALKHAIQEKGCLAGNRFFFYGPKRTSQGHSESEKKNAGKQHGTKSKKL